MNSTTISQRKKVQTLQCHDYTCQACGADAGDVGGKAKMRVGFIPRNNASIILTDADLKTSCPDCDEGFSTATLFPRMNAKALQREIGRAPASDQLAVCNWLQKACSPRRTK